MGNSYKETYYEDQNGTLRGKLFLSQACCIDFDKRNVYINGKSKNISSKNFDILEFFIFNKNRVISYNILIEEFWDFVYSDSDDERQMVRMAIKRIRDIDDEIREKLITRAGTGFIFVLDENDNQKTEAIQSSFDFSRKFFHSGANQIIDYNESEINVEVAKLSKLFNNISSLKHRDNYIEINDFSENIYEIIVNGCRQLSNNNILKIKGPLGSYKNRLLQYLYLKILKSETDILPFYIDISMYEKTYSNNAFSSGKSFENLFKSDFSNIKEIINCNKHLTPLIILDGIRDFSTGKNYLYSYVAKQIFNKEYKVVVCLDTDFTINQYNRLKFHPLAPSTFEYFLRISSMQLYSKEDSINFINNCIEIFNVDINGISVETIYEKFVKMNLMSMDAYWIVHLLKIMLDNIVYEELTISDLYNALCIKFIDDTKLIDSAAEWAFNYEYNKIDFSDEEFFFDVRWKLIRKHRSMLDYLIARHYVNKLSQLDLENGDREKIIKNLQFFNMVLQKSITRFIVTMLHGIDDYEHKILAIAEHYYDDLSVLGKSELTFWLGRLNNPVRKKQSVRYLNEFKNKEVHRYQNTTFSSDYKLRNSVFLIRGIEVSLIYENDKSALRDYMLSLLNNKTANEINRGFHLEYYGDKAYIPKKTLLDFKDVLSKGENTFNVLCISLEQKIKDKAFDYVAVLEVFTLCSLIQARLENTSKKVLDVADYINKVIVYLNWILKQRIPIEIFEIKNYFKWALSEFSEINRLECKSFIKSRLFDEFSKAALVHRTGWVDRNIPNAENIVEHMYNCWLIALFYLPDFLEDNGYNKQCVLNMLLIHDLGETVTGDITRPIKQLNKEYYDSQENDAVQSLLMADTYPSMPSLYIQKECWNTWFNELDINYFIAKDIDNIQTIYQCCEYYIKYPNHFSDDDMLHWLEGLRRINTDEGKRICDFLIVNNSRFASIFNKFSL